MLKKRYRVLSWKVSRWWYQVKIFLGWWYCEHCEKLHSPFQPKYEFDGDEQYECHKGVYDLPVPKSYGGDPDYFYNLAKDLHRVG